MPGVHIFDLSIGILLLVGSLSVLVDHYQLGFYHVKVSHDMLIHYLVIIKCYHDFRVIAYILHNFSANPNMTFIWI